MSPRVIPMGDFFVFPYVWRLTDEALLAGFSVGDAGAAETFIARFQSRVYGIALAITRDARLAEDLAQEAFLRAWRHAQTFDPPPRERRDLVDRDHAQPRRRRHADTTPLRVP